MSAANEELDKKIKRDGKDAVNIENLTSDNSPHVAMVTKQSLKANRIIQKSRYSCYCYRIYLFLELLQMSFIRVEALLLMAMTTMMTKTVCPVLAVAVRVVMTAVTAKKRSTTTNRMKEYSR